MVDAKKIVLSRALTNSGDQAWDFVLPVALAVQMPGRLDLVAFVFFISKLGHILLMPMLGDFMDRVPRLLALKSGLGLQGSGILIQAVALINVTHEFNFSLLAIIIGALLAGSGATVTGIAVTQDLVPSLFQGNELTRVNSRMRQVDLASEVLSPVLAGLILLIHSSKVAQLGVLLVALWNFLSFFPEYFLLKMVLTKHQEKLQRIQTHNVRLNLLAKLSSGWKELLKLSIAPAVFAYAFLWMSALSPHGVLLTSFLKETWGMPELILGVFRGLGALFGLLATFIFPILVSRYGLIPTSLLSILFQAGTLIIGLVGFHIQNSWIFLSAILFSRVGLYTFSLGEQQIRQVGIPEQDRGKVNASASALNNLATLALFGLASVLGAADHFSRLVDFSVLSVVIGALIFWRLKILKSKTILFVFLVITHLNTFADQNQTFKVWSYPATFSFTHEQVRFSKSEASLGLSSFSLLRKYDSGLLLGLSSYSATLGELGGLISIGWTIGFDQKIWNRLSVKTNFYAGGGGKTSSNYSGSGLLLRASSAVHWNQSQYAIGLGYSYLNFPDGRIKGSQFYAAVDLATDFSLLENFSSPNPNESGEKLPIPMRDRMELIPSMKLYSTSNVRAVGGAKMAAHLDMLGLEFHRKLRFTNFYTLFHYYTSVAGHDGGFALGGLGLNYRFFIFPRLSLIPQLAMTFGGGSTVPSGGGLFFEPQLGLNFQFSPSIGVRSGISYTYSPSDVFDVPVVFAQGVFVLESARAVSSKNKKVELKTPELFSKSLRLSASNQHYFFSGVKRRVSGLEFVDLNLLGISFDFFFNRYFFSGIETDWVYSGDAGGYASGTLNLGAHVDVFQLFFLELKSGVGAGAGGLVPSNGGVMFHGAGGIGVNLSSDWAVGTHYGLLYFPSGPKRNYLRLTLSHSFDFPTTKLKAL